ncbi:MAG: hypothetical protein ABIF19_06010 [Planctomycetota bacterium]
MSTCCSSIGRIFSGGRVVRARRSRAHYGVGKRIFGEVGPADLIGDNNMEHMDLAEFCRQWLTGRD